MKRCCSVVFLFTVLFVAITAQATDVGEIRGKVIDAITKKPIPGASIILKDTLFSTTSDKDGNYVLRNVPFNVYTITCLYVGYQPVSIEKVRINNTKPATYNFFLQPRVAGASEYEDDTKKSNIDKDKTSSETTKKPIESGKKPRTTTPADDAIDHDSSSTTTTPYDGTKPDKPIIDTSRIPKAGEHDDNEEFPAFLDFFKRFPTFAPELAMVKKDIEGRVIISVVDKNGAPIQNALLVVNGKQFHSANDGDIMLFPADLGSSNKKNIKAFVTYEQETKDIALTFETAVRQQVRFGTVRKELSKVPVDIVFTLDTTGSMGDEIDILRDTIYSIYTRIRKLDNTAVDLRFGIVLYRDKGDVYLTQQFPLTDKIEAFQEFLFNVRAGGGGDTPEDLLSGLNETVNNMNWRDDALKLAFVVTDAPGHIPEADHFRTILDAARTRTIKIFAIGASGLDTTGEMHLRITAQHTKGSFIFLTYGETGESSGKDEGKVSHHTGTNFTSRNLDDIVVDNVSRQIRFLAPASALTALHQNYNFKAEEERISIRTENAFQQIYRQLQSKSSKDTTILVLPPDTDNTSLKEMSVFVQSYLEKTIVDTKALTLVDRSKLGKVLEEIQLKLMGLTEGEDFSKLAHAKIILSSRLYYIGDSKVLFLRLISTDTSEVLAASMVRI